MKRLIVLALAIIILPSVMAQVKITEVLYDPETSELDTEFVEIYNQGESQVDIGEWILNTTSIQAIIPIGTIIQPDSYYLIADEDDGGNWPSSWPEPDYSGEEISLVNTDSGIQLLDANGNLQDIVGWGAPPQGLFETQAHEEVSSGESLTRIKINGSYVDTDNNFDDFYGALPNPSNSNQIDEESIEINLFATVSGSAPRINSLNISPDESLDTGIQVYPSPGKNKSLIIETTISDSEGYDDILSVIGLFESGDIDFIELNQINITSSSYQGQLNMEFFYAPKNYSIELVVLDNSGLETRQEINFEYLGVVAFNVDTEYISYNGNSGSISEVLGDINMDTSDKPTVKNIGNMPLDFNIFGSDLTSEFDVIPINNIEYTFLDNDYLQGGVLSNQPVLHEVNLHPGLNQLREFTTRLNIPTGASIGDYSGELSLVGVVS